MDAARLGTWRTSPVAQETLIGGGTTDSATAAREWIETSLCSDNMLRFIIEDLEMRPVGFCGLYMIDATHRRAEFGILIGEADARGRGLGTKVTSEILRVAFDELGLNRVFLELLASNSLARRVYEKCGFQLEGRARAHVLRNGRFVDVLSMGILADEFRQRRPGGG